MSKMFIKNLIIEATHGVYDHEKTTPQNFIINLTLDVETPLAFTSDDVSDTVDYAKIRDDIIAITKNNSYNLIERLAEEIVARVLSDQRVKEVTISIDKPDAFESGVPGIQITRTHS